MDHREQFCIEIKDGSTESLNVNKRSYCKDQRKQLFDTLLSPDGLECVVPVSPVKIRRLMKGLQMRTVDNISPSMTVSDFLITSTPSTVTTNENVRRRNNPGNQLLRPACKRGVLPRFIYQRCLKTSPSAADQRGNATKVVPVFTSAERSKMADRFDCDNCKESLYGRKYIQSDDSPYCIPCYDSLFSNTCDECKELIGHDARELFYEDRHYHEHCFRCFRCDRSLADEPFTSQDDALLCNDCYCNEFSSKCVACDKIVMPGTRKLEYSGSTWHEGCFICHSCEQPIGSKSFIPDKDLHYCVPCYEDKFAPRCARCKKTLAKGGVTYRDEPFHKECFVCTNCTTQLAGQHFTSREDSPYCLKCFGSLYAKKCEACSKPITGFGGGKYISFEDRQWHQPCFTCSQCSVSLVGAGFFPNDERILCRDCHTNL